MPFDMAVPNVSFTCMYTTVFGAAPAMAKTSFSFRRGDLRPHPEFVRPGDGSHDAGHDGSDDVLNVHLERELRVGKRARLRDALDRSGPVVVGRFHGGLVEHGVGEEIAETGIGCEQGQGRLVAMRPITAANGLRLARPGSLARALDEAKKERADSLSYSPEQVVVTLAERAMMPVVFAELARQYPPHKVRQENSGVVAANGQYILVRRAAYVAVGGHTAVATEILEDVALARLFHNAGHRIYFRYGGDAVRTRMYHNWDQLCEGWTKNLALLFPHPEWRAVQSIFVWFLAWAALIVAASGSASGHFAWIAFSALWLFAYRRIGSAHFTPANNLIAMALGLPMFAYLLLRSKRTHANGRVKWKDRTYSTGVPSGSTPPGMQSAKPISRIENQGLRAKS